MQSTSQGTYQPNPKLPAITAHIFNDSQLQQSILSVSDFTDAGCTATFTRDSCTISLKSNTLITASKSTAEKLWHLPLIDSKQIATCNASIHHQATADYVAFHHAALGSPPHTTLLNGVKLNYLPTLPDLTAKMISKNPPITTATAKGHLNLNRQNQNSSKLAPANPATTKVKQSSTTAHNETDNEFVNNSDHEDIIQSIVDFSNIKDYSTIHSDLTGKFPVRSRNGNQYILVSVLKNYCYGVAMQSRSADDYLIAFKTTHDHFKRLGHNIKFQKMDNESSELVETFFKQANIIVEFVPPNNHRTNKAEPAIRDYKNHLISTLATTHESFPLELWDHVIPQVNITINLLRPYSPNQKISAYHGIHKAPYDFHGHPLAPVGTRVLIHESPDKRPTWAPHGLHGYYIGPALDHYRCFNVYLPSTKSFRVTDTVAWFPAPLILPGSQPIEYVHSAINELHMALLQLLNHPTTKNNENLQEQNNKLKAIDTIKYSLRNTVDNFFGKQEERPDQLASNTTTPFPEISQVPAPIPRVSKTAEPTRILRSGTTAQAPRVSSVGKQTNPKKSTLATDPLHPSYRSTKTSLRSPTKTSGTKLK